MMYSDICESPSLKAGVITQTVGNQSNGTGLAAATKDKDHINNTLTTKQTMKLGKLSIRLSPETRENQSEHQLLLTVSCQPRPLWLFEIQMTTMKPTTYGRLPLQLNAQDTHGLERPTPLPQHAHGGHVTTDICSLLRRMEG